MIKKLKTLEQNRYFIYSLLKMHSNSILNKVKTMVLQHLIYYPSLEIQRVLISTGKNKAILESLLNEISKTGSNLILNFSNSFSTKEWDDINKKVKENKQKYLAKISAEIISADDNQKIILSGSKLLLEYLCSSGVTFKNLYMDNIERHEKLFNSLEKTLGKISCKILYIKLCLEILLGLNSKNNDLMMIQHNDLICAEYKKKIYDSLIKEDFEHAAYFANELCLLSEIVALNHASIANSYQKARTGAIESKKIELIVKELQEITLMNARINDYAIGLYFYILSPEELKTECGFAKKLTYEKPKSKASYAGINEILGNIEGNISKTVRLKAVVGSIDQKKWFINGKEAVKTEIVLKEAQAQIKLVLHGHLLKDNGLTEDAIMDVTGILSKDENGVVYIKMLAHDLDDISKSDWISRSLWLANSWWDYGTDNVQAQWTLSKLTPEQFPGINLEFIAPCKKEELQMLIKELKNKYPPFMAAVWADKKVFSLVDKLGKKEYLDNLKELYIESLSIDKLINITISNG